MSEIEHKSLVTLLALMNAKLDASTHQLNAIRHERDKAIASAEGFQNRLRMEKIKKTGGATPFDYQRFSIHRSYLERKKKEEIQRAVALNPALSDWTNAVKKDLNACVAIELLKEKSEKKKQKKLLDMNEAERERLTSLSLLKQL